MHWHVRASSCIFAAFFGITASFMTPAAAGGLPGVAAPGAAAYDWSGAYLGLSAGGGWGDAGWRYDEGMSPTPNPLKFSDVLGGAHIGYQRQWGNFVAGIEGNYIFHGMEGCSDCPNDEFRCNVQMQGVWSVGPRIGYARNNILVYATGGYAQGRFKTDAQLKSTGIRYENTAQSHDGFFIGGGVDLALTQNIILGVDYQHIDFNGADHVDSLTSRTINPDLNIVRARLTFKLDTPRLPPNLRY